MEHGCNPFAPGAGLDPPYLAGREGELRAFDGMLRRAGGAGRGGATDIVLHGLRGVGKTVLLGRFARACRGRGFLALARYQYSAKESDPDAFAASLEYALRSAVEPRAGAEPAADGPSAAGARRGPPAAGTSGASGTAHRGPPSPRSRSAQLADRLAGCLVDSWKAIDGLGYSGAVFLFDEFHTIRDVKRNDLHVLAYFLGAVGEARRQGCGYCAVLSGLPGLLKNARAAASRVGVEFGPMELSNLSRDDGRRAIARPLADVGRGFSPDLLDAVLDDAGGYPYFIQLLASEVLERFDGRMIGLGEYRSIRKGLIRDLCRSFFGQRMAELSPPEEETLRLMSAMPGADAAFSSILRGAGCSRGALLSRLRRLEAKGIVCRRGRGLYGFAMPLLGPCLASGQGGPD